MVAAACAPSSRCKPEQERDPGRALWVAGLEVSLGLASRSQWLELHLHQEIPTSLLILSRAMYLPAEGGNPDGRSSQAHRPPESWCVWRALCPLAVGPLTAQETPPAHSAVCPSSPEGSAGRGKVTLGVLLPRIRPGRDSAQRHWLGPRAALARERLPRVGCAHGLPSLKAKEAQVKAAELEGEQVDNKAKTGGHAAGGGGHPAGAPAKELQRKGQATRPGQR